MSQAKVSSLYLDGKSGDEVLVAGRTSEPKFNPSDLQALTQKGSKNVCDVERMSRPSSHRPSRIPTDGERFNEELFVDVCDLVDVRGNRYAWLVVIDQHTDNTVFTGGSRQLISTGFGGHTFRVPWRVRRSERVVLR